MFPTLTLKGKRLLYNEFTQYIVGQPKSTERRIFEPERYTVEYVSASPLAQNFVWKVIFFL